MTFAQKVLHFNNSLDLGNIQLPPKIEVMNPFQGEHAALIQRVTQEFYHKFYNDNKKRHLILGINPGRFGAGLTGVPFSDTKRLLSDCGIEVTEVKSHEPSSVFVYEVIRAYGGAEAFYEQFYISSLCPLGFIIENDKGKMVNYNYYDQKDLEEAVTPFIIQTLQQQIDIGNYTDKCFCMGTGKNYKFFQKLNKQHQFFDEIIPLEHPRFVVQYRTKRMPEFVEKYLKLLGS